MNEDDHFLKRWSRRKTEAKERAPARDGQAFDSPQEGQQGSDQAHARGDGEAEQPALDRQGATVLTEEDFADVDFEALDMQSDYGRFLAPGVPDSIKHKALRKLWASNSIFSQVDPFQDYADDYTDAARAVPPGTLKTAYRIGKGFLTDEEVAEWERLGVPEPEKVADAARVAERVDAPAVEEPSHVKGGDEISAASASERESNTLPEPADHPASPPDAATPVVPKPANTDERPSDA